MPTSGESYDGLGNLSKEIADVILTAMILAERLGIDVEESLKEKIEIVKGRTYKVQPNHESFGTHNV